MMQSLYLSSTEKSLFSEFIHRSNQQNFTPLELITLLSQDKCGNGVILKKIMAAFLDGWDKNAVSFMQIVPIKSKKNLFVFHRTSSLVTTEYIPVFNYVDKALKELHPVRAQADILFVQHLVHEDH